MAKENKLLKYKIFLLIGDISLLYLAFFLSLKLRYGVFLKYPFSKELFWYSTIAYVIWLGVLYILDFYENPRGENIDFFQKLSVFIIVGPLLPIILFYLFPIVTPKTLLLLNIILFSIFFYGWRTLCDKLFKSSFKTRIAFVEFNPQLPELIQKLNRSFCYGYEATLCFNESNKGKNFNKLKEAAKFTKIGLITDINRLKKLIEQKKIQSLVVASNLHVKESLAKALFLNLPFDRLNFIAFPVFYEYITKKIPLESINELWFLENLDKKERKLYKISKRGFDILLALIGFIPFLIILPFIALYIKLDSEGPVFYQQIRPGKGNTVFKIWKFRTMTQSSKPFEGLTKKNDKRITKTGLFLRKFHLDELPQLINILKGEMSFVGPRAIPLESAKKMSERIPFYIQRQMIKPGITGWAQINSPYFSSHIKEEYEKLQYDLYYIKNRSFIFDLGIILKTIKRILVGKGR